MRLRPATSCSRSPPREYLRAVPEPRGRAAADVSWGDKGYSEVWLNGTNDWIYRHLHRARTAWSSWPATSRSPSGLQRRALNQAARELLLAQSTDWAFIMKTGTMVEYAKKRTRDHVARFNYLYRMLASGGFLEEPIAQRVRGAGQHLPGYRLQGVPLAGTG